MSQPAGRSRLRNELGQNRHQAKTVCRLAMVLAAALALLAPATSIRADDHATIEELKARLDAVERQNQTFQESLNERKAAKSDSPSKKVVPAGGEEPAAEQDDEHIRSVVRDYLISEKKEKGDGADDPEWYEVGSDLSMHASWKNGLEIETKNKDFRIKVRGRTQLDFASFSVPDNVNADPSLVVPIRSGVDFRRARIGVEGVMFEQIDYIYEYDFVNSVLAMPSAAGPANVVGVPAPTDLYWTFMKLPVVGNFRVGNQKEPIGMEHLTSSRYLPFMERSFNQDAFYGGFNNGFTPGLMFFNSVVDDRMTWALGVFKPTTNVFAFDQSDGDYAVTGRVTALPWYVDDGNGLWHVGASARQAGMDNGVWRFRTRGPERSGLSQNWSLYADSGKIVGVNQQWYNFETALQLGPFMASAEYLFAFVHDAARGNAATVGTTMYQGGYVEALYFLTGESRGYTRKNGWYERVVPYENSFLVSDETGKTIFGRGAWQVGARFNYLDLNDKGINGGRLKDVTFGLNWFLNPNMKVQWNYSITDRQSINVANTGLIQGFGMRLAHDF
ncbi:MAG: hypothetical protein HY290_01515 [Planctomycetia bacterium]|nr:hypothetical protein [Planctomycetia bacterium]